jgi:hypothetical protein
MDDTPSASKQPWMRLPTPVIGFRSELTCLAAFLAATVPTLSRSASFNARPLDPRPDYEGRALDHRQGRAATTMYDHERRPTMTQWTLIRLLVANALVIDWLIGSLSRRPLEAREVKTATTSAASTSR